MSSRLSRTGRRMLALVVPLALLATVSTPALGLRHSSFPKGVGALVSLGKVGQPAPSPYLGVSLEMSGLCSFLETYAQYPTQLVNLFRDLSPVVFKVGGKGSDYATWEPNGTPDCSFKGTVLTASQVQSVFAFARAAKAKVLWGLPLINYNPKAAATQAAYVASVGKSSLMGWSIGNEPDIYPSSGLRTKATWNPAAYFAQWKATRAAVLKAVPGSKFVGPEFCCNDLYFSGFAPSARGLIEALSYHAYGGSWKNISTPDLLLAQHTAETFANRAASHLATARQIDHVPLWLTETNSFAAGGVRGISDTYMSSLWLADELFRGFRVGLGQVDVQDVSGYATYDPISGAAQAMPDYYGPLFYHASVPAGARLVITKLAAKYTASNLTTYGVRLKSGALNVIVFNKGSNPVTARVTVDQAYASASYFQMLAPSLDSQSVTIGGSAVAGDGTMPAPVTTALPLTGKFATLTLAADTATCITFQPSEKSKH